MSDWEGVRLHVVTGKGGTGKTTVAAALALALAAGGRKVLLVEVEGRQGLAQLFDVPPLSYDETKIAVGPDGGDVFGLSVDPRTAVYEYLEMYYHLGRAGKALERFGAIEFATTIAPGLRDVLLTGKTYEAVRRRTRDGRFAYDAVVLDAPPTGRITRFLNVNEEVAGLARMGPIHRQSESIMSMMRAPMTKVHVVTILEEMPVQETSDAVAELTRAGLPVGGVMVNLVRRPALDPAQLAAARQGSLDRAEVLAGLVAAGIGDGGTGGGRDDVVAALLDEGHAHAERVGLEEGLRLEVAGLDLPVYELPRMPDGIDLGALYALADELHEQGAA